MGVSGGNRLVAFTRVIRPICGDAADVLIGRDLVQEFGQAQVMHRAKGDVVFVVGPDMLCDHFSGTANNDAIHKAFDPDLTVTRRTVRSVFKSG